MLVFRHFRRLRVHRLPVGRRLLRFGVGGGRVWLVGSGLVRFARFCRMRAMVYHFFVSWGQLTGQK